MPTATLSRKGIGGPKTPEGKRRVSLNALKHGLHAESPQAQDKIAEEIGVSFMQVLEDVCTQCQPMDTIEMAFVRRIARSVYRLRITEAMEDNLLQRRGIQSRPSESHERILLLERRIDLQLHRAIAALATKRIREQKNRQNKLPSPYVPAMDPSPQPSPGVSGFEWSSAERKSRNTPDEDVENKLRDLPPTIHQAHMSHVSHRSHGPWPPASDAYAHVGESSPRGGNVARE